MKSEPLWRWINERHAIFIRKGLAEGKIPRWSRPAVPPRAVSNHCDCDEKAAFTEDEILKTYRFTNVFRELDRVTVWIRENIREPYADHPDLWFMLAMARYINWPPAVEELMASGAWPDRSEFRTRHMTELLEARKARGEKVETGAFMTRPESHSTAPWYSWSKQRYVSEIVLGRLWEDRKRWKSLLDSKPTMQAAHAQFLEQRYIGWGPFTAYQVVLDWRWTKILSGAPDINSWAALGPGSRRGLNRLAGRQVKAPLSQEKGLAEMIKLLEQSPDQLAPWVPPLELSDIQNCLCEVDKYLRAKNGEGRPRTRYVPGRGY